MLARQVLRKAEPSLGIYMVLLPYKLMDGIGAGTLTKSITQQFSQGNIAQSSNTLDMAVSGQGFFVMQGGGNAGQNVYTRNGIFGKRRWFYRR